MSRCDKGDKVVLSHKVTYKGFSGYEVTRDNCSVIGMIVRRGNALDDMFCIYDNASGRYGVSI